MRPRPAAASIRPPAWPARPIALQGCRANRRAVPRPQCSFRGADRSVRLQPDEKVRLKADTTGEGPPEGGRYRMFGKSASRGDDDRQFDPRRSVRTLCHGKAEPGAVANAGRDRHLDRMSNELEPAATACRAGFSPRFTAPTALDARALDRHAERDRDTVGGFAVGQLDDGTKRVGTLVSQERAPDTLDRRRHRRKV